MGNPNVQTPTEPDISIDLLCLQLPYERQMKPFHQLGEAVMRLTYGYPFSHRIYVRLCEKRFHILKVKRLKTAPCIP